MGVRRYVRIAAGVTAVAGVVGVGAAVTANGGQRGFRERLTGFEEVPALSTTGQRQRSGRSISRSDDEISYRVTFSGLETQRHAVAHPLRERDEQRADRRLPVHEPRQRPGRHAGLPGRCDGGTIEGTIAAADVGGGAADQGIAAGDFDEFVDAIRAGATYVNVHTVGVPGGEIRAQINDDHCD